MSSPLVAPSSHGIVMDMNDALILFQLALDNKLPLTKRRLQEKERPRLIKSGAIFLFSEQKSGIKRWTDGVSWSPSRIMQNFLIYREVKKDESGHRKGITTKTRPGSRTSKMWAYDRERSRSPEGHPRVDTALVGSLADSESFKEDGLIKKTISVSYRGEQYHLISYYSLQDATNGTLVRISDNKAYAALEICQELLNSGSFRVPLEFTARYSADGREAHYGPMDYIPQNYGHTSFYGYGQLPPYQYEGAEAVHRLGNYDPHAYRQITYSQHETGYAEDRQRLHASNYVEAIEPSEIYRSPLDMNSARITPRGVKREVVSPPTFYGHPEGEYTPHGPTHTLQSTSISRGAYEFTAPPTSYQL